MTDLRQRLDREGVVRVRERPTLGRWTVLAGLGFLAAGAVILLVPPAAVVTSALAGLRGVVGLAGVGLGVGTVVLGVRGLVRPRTVVVVDTRGVQVDRYPPLPWPAVADVEVRTVSYAAGHQLLLRLADGVPAPAPRGGVVAPLLHRLGAALLWGPGCVPVRADLEVPPAELRDLLLHARDRA